MAGKGSKWRETDFGRYFKNADIIKSDKKEPKSKEKKNLKNGKVRYIY